MQWCQRGEYGKEVLRNQCLQTWESHEKGEGLVKRELFFKKGRQF